MGHMAEAIMTKSFINPRARKYFKEKEEVLALLLCLVYFLIVYKQFKFRGCNCWAKPEGLIRGFLKSRFIFQKVILSKSAISQNESLTDL